MKHTCQFCGFDLRWNKTRQRFEEMLPVPVTMPWVCMGIAGQDVHIPADWFQAH